MLKLSRINQYLLHHKDASELMNVTIQLCAFLVEQAVSVDPYSATTLSKMGIKKLNSRKKLKKF